MNNTYKPYIFEVIDIDDFYKILKHNYIYIEEFIENANFNRPILSSHVDELVIYIKNKINKNEYPHLGVIEIGYYKKDINNVNSTAIVYDGQHRLEAIKKLKQENISIPFIFYISLFNTIDEIKTMFINRNKCIQVADWVLEADSSNINLYKEIRKYLLYNYSQTFKEGNVRRPHINVDLFINDIKKYILDKKITFKTLNDFISEFNRINNIYKAKLITKELGLCEKTINTIKNNNIYFAFLKDEYFLYAK